MTAAGIVLAGGRSIRMGTSKADLAWHGSTMLHRVAGIVRRAVGGPVIVVRAEGQALPTLPAGVDVVADAREGRGPLEGFAAGLAAIGDAAGAVFVTATDAPLLHPALIDHVLAQLVEGVDAAVPVAHGRRHPLASAYRTHLRPTVAGLLAADELKMGQLLEHCRTMFIDEATLTNEPELAAADPDLTSLLNVNTPEDYRDLLSRPAPSVTLGRSGEDRDVTVRAYTLGDVLRSAGVPSGASCRLLLNGSDITPGPQLPLVQGDRVDIGRIPRPLSEPGAAS